MKKIGSLFTTGFIALASFGVAGLIAYKIWDSIYPGFYLTGWAWLNTLITLAIIFIGICVFGWLCCVKRFRDIVDPIMGSLPIISVLWQILPRAFGNFPEVLFDLFPGVKARGVVVKEWQEGGEVYCRVYVASCPVPISGYFVEPKKALLEYTGYEVKGYFALVVSFGAASRKNENPPSAS